MGLFGKKKVKKKGKKREKKKKPNDGMADAEEPWLLKGEMKKVTVIFQERKMRNHKMKVKTKSFIMEIPVNLYLEDLVKKVKLKLKV